MKSVEFNEEQFSDLNKLGQLLFDDENDPTSLSYKRILIRPKINRKKLFFFSALPVIASLLIFIVLEFFNIPYAIKILSIAVFLTFYILINLKKTVICMIKIYQRYAPDSLRNKCRFEPSCSEYMLSAINKYGLFKGTKKGINRLKRCNIDNGGFDFP